MKRKHAKYIYVINLNGGVENCALLSFYKMEISVDGDNDEDNDELADNCTVYKNSR